MSSIITIQQPPSVHGELPTAYEEEQEDALGITPVAEEMPADHVFDNTENSEYEEDFCAVREPSIGNDSEPEALPRYSSSSSREGGDEYEGEEEVKTPSAEDLVAEAERNAARTSSLEKLQGTAVPSISYPPPSKGPGTKSPKKKGRRRSRIPEGIIILKEERATIFHDFLKFVYPQ